jgi:hypothetical protein
MGRSGFLERLRTAGLLLALFALTFKALLPPGYMLAPVHGGPVTVTLCTLNGLVDAAVTLPGGAHDEQPSGHQEREMAPCVFAAVGALDVPIASPAARTPLVVAQAFEWPPASAQLASQGLAPPPPWPTGPPASI